MTVKLPITRWRFQAKPHAAWPNSTGRASEVKGGLRDRGSAQGGVLARTAAGTPFPPAQQPLYGALPRSRASAKHHADDGRIAQLVEQLTLNQRVLGSSPSASTTHNLRFLMCRFARLL